MIDWTEKYRPRTLDEVIGNDQAKDMLRRWADEWKGKKLPEKRGMIIYGRPGIGKTSSALALANEYGWVAIEMNASDVRNAENIKKIAGSGAINETFSDSGEYLGSSGGGRKLIILDEADNLYERRSGDDTSGDLLDKGGKKAIIEILRSTRQPIILIANDLRELLRGGEPLKDLCEIVRFDERKIRIGEIVNYLRKIARSEGVNVDNDVLTYLAERCKGDIRSAIRDLQVVSAGRKNVGKEDLKALSYRDREQNVFDVLREIFKTRNIASISRSVRDLDEDPENLILWVSENVPYEYLDAIDLSNAYDMLSRADVFLGRARRTRSFALWRYAQDLMTGGVATAKKRFYPIQPRYSFPSWLIEMKASKERRDIRANIIEKISRLTHCSKKKVNEFFDQICKMMRSDEEIAIRLKEVLELSREEVLYLVEDEEIANRILKGERIDRLHRKIPKRVEQKSLF